MVLTVEVTFDDQNIIDGKRSASFSSADPVNLAWGGIRCRCGNSNPLASSLIQKASSSHCRCSQGSNFCPAKGEGAKTIVLGVNEGEVTGRRARFFLMLRTTNCIAPIMKVPKTLV